MISPVATAGADITGQSPQSQDSATELHAQNPAANNATAIPGLKYTFGITVESEVARNRDLNKDVKDKLALIGPELTWLQQAATAG